MGRSRNPEYRFTFQECPGSGQPPYRYDPNQRVGKKNPKTGRMIYAKARCEVCGHDKAVNVNGTLRKHKQKVQL